MFNTLGFVPKTKISSHKYFSFKYLFLIRLRDFATWLSKINLLSFKIVTQIYVDSGYYCNWF